jgi:hypothetical protein
VTLNRSSAVVLLVLALVAWYIGWGLPALVLFVLGIVALLA